MIPRRMRLDKSEPAELAIRNAVSEVEKIGADDRLTKAINLLHEARELVADFIEEKLIPHGDGEMRKPESEESPITSAANRIP